MVGDTLNEFEVRMVTDGVDAHESSCPFETVRAGVNSRLHKRHFSVNGWLHGRQQDPMPHNRRF